MSFLIGKVSIVVTTVAFGMEARHSTRHALGAPKTLEEYCNGLPAMCTMFAELKDFAKYKDNFYLGSLTGRARSATVHSMDALCNFAMRMSGC